MDSAHPYIGLLLIGGLLILWLVGLLQRWKWACDWKPYGKLWMLDDCTAETKRRIQIILISLALLGWLAIFIWW